MKMKTLIVVMAVCLCLSILYGCGSNTESGNAGAPAGQETAADVKKEGTSGGPAEQGAQAAATTVEGEIPETEPVSEEASESASLAAVAEEEQEEAQEAQAGSTADRTVVSGDDKSGVWTIPVSGMDITLPESWRSSDCYISYRSSAVQPDLVITNCVVYAATEYELEEAVQQMGEESDELGAYLDERVNDMFIILSVSDILSKKNVMELFEQDDHIAEFIADLPELFDNIRFYEPEEKPSTKAGSAVSFETVDFDGNKVDSRELFAKNRYTMINLWTSWCTYCLQEMPALEEMNREFAEDGGAVIGVMLDGDMEKELETGREIRDETGVTYPLLVPTARMKEQLIARAYPTTIFVDSNGIVVGDPIVGMDLNKYRDRMEDLLAGDPSEAVTEEEEKEDEE